MLNQKHSVKTQRGKTRCSQLQGLRHLRVHLGKFPLPVVVITQGLVSKGQEWLCLRSMSFSTF